MRCGDRFWGKGETRQTELRGNTIGSQLHPLLHPSNLSVHAILSMCSFTPCIQVVWPFLPFCHISHSPRAISEGQKENHGLFNAGEFWGHWFSQWGTAKFRVKMQLWFQDVWFVLLSKPPHQKKEGNSIWKVTEHLINQLDADLIHWQSFLRQIDASYRSGWITKNPHCNTFIT